MLPGITELAIITGLVIFLFGHKHIPVLGKLFGRATGEFKKSFGKAARLPEFFAEIEKEEDTGKTADDRRK